ncbi:MAG: hypothetical protein A3I77_02985 [Gammaproteobacteria bacterium RIFCSPLOWO2_02_FULL_42_14]|nr:MAG: hypothetical protein A3B71_08180 [Gammaproteobacteria bacterium RIFCSPHIGHO2_02_FULL_42_43]OGT27771.1 MAG: hypothetical protein A2624_01690 [Gammaproteobacteria bacterium RIFCSPHIGHO2_01_FULL_42_8]OGT52390.1 MAG: hypothetical protein A3E54_02055 [Gammaproteobacteria bacterium RIFCSPHIGHO2_12_FULL_41_25]OGT62482.1 MAG: hypothetical protein A3I77_02985 [Gammaproteobacteria bacterium RIFCSPLOWO2_02_FULL_42_14]OGT86286.1 MAG: hypothetical protein A3G86_07100 [Gammaproteobacteria bacterium R
MMKDIPYTVSRLNREANALLSGNFGAVSVIGEVSNVSRPSSGHLYFSLKDDQAQIRCAFFRFQHATTDFVLEHGQQIIVQAQVGLYEPRGDFQLIVTRIQLAGAGKLQIAFDQLKKKLEKQGLFDEKHKKPLPLFPKQIGVITSASAAALRDVLKVLKKRFLSIPVIIYPTLVQGELAANNIASAIQIANARAECDVLILARGGGSLEDLWPFNEEIVAHAIFKSVIPIITGIGHQTDFTIADFVADVRAPTPSAAAEIASPDRQALAQRLDQHEKHLMRVMQFVLRDKKSQMISIHDLEKMLRQKIKAAKETLTHLKQTLTALNPRNILKRGYSITRNQKTGQLIRHAKEVSPNDMMITQLSDGEILSRVE